MKTRSQIFPDSPKKKQLAERIFKTRDLTRADAFDYIQVFYNPRWQLT